MDQLKLLFYLFIQNISQIRLKQAKREEKLKFNLPVFEFKNVYFFILLHFI